MLDLTQADLVILQDVLRARLPPATNVWIFGSRATGTARRYSDLDLALKGREPLSLDLLGELADALSESDLTIKVDLVDLHDVDPTFRQRIIGGMIPLPHCAEWGE